VRAGRSGLPVADPDFPVVSPFAESFSRLACATICARPPAARQIEERLLRIATPLRSRTETSGPGTPRLSQLGAGHRYFKPPNHYLGTTKSQKLD
jgi:hypothetical protein